MRRCSIRSWRPRKWSPPTMSAKAASGSTSWSAGTRANSRCSASSSATTSDRYEYAQEWIDVIKKIWSDQEDFDFDGKYLQMKGVRGKPKPYGGTQPVIMNAGASPVGQAFAIRNCDAFFLQASRTSLDETAQKVADAKSAAKDARARTRRLYGRRRHLQADHEGSAGLLSPLHRGARRLVGGRQHPRAQEHHRAEHAAGEVPQDPHRLRPGHGRPAHRRRPRPCGRRSSST